MCVALLLVSELVLCVERIRVLRTKIVKNFFSKFLPSQEVPRLKTGKRVP